VSNHLPNQAAPSVYLITDRRRLKSSHDKDRLQALIEFIELAFASGIDMLQIRELDLSTRDIFKVACSAAESAARWGRKVLVNDRADVAAAAGTGVHLTTRSIDATVIRRCFGRDILIGVSTHSLQEAKAAEAAGADFVVFGPVFDTESKRVYGPPVGIEALRETASRLRVPVLALGGITACNFHQPLEAGAAGIAGISLFSDTADLPGIVRALKRPR
jgi:thiamine-phosphate pyrophosphorylase